MDYKVECYIEKKHETKEKITKLSERQRNEITEKALTTFFERKVLVTSK